MPPMFRPEVRAAGLALEDRDLEIEIHAIDALELERAVLVEDFRDAA